MELDHLVVSGQTLDEAIEYIECSLGMKLQLGGKHKHFGTHNALLGLGPEIYLEAIAIDPSAVSPPAPRWFNLDKFYGKPKLKNWVCRCKNIDYELCKLPRQENYIVELKRNQFSWLMSVPHNGILIFDESFPALIEWKSDFHPAKSLKESSCRLKRLTICHPKAHTIKKNLKMLSSDKICFEQNSTIQMFAEFITPSGIRFLE